MIKIVVIFTKNKIFYSNEKYLVFTLNFPPYF